jgi:hypothetical protein
LSEKIVPKQKKDQILIHPRPLNSVFYFSWERFRLFYQGFYAAKPGSSPNEALSFVYFQHFLMQIIRVSLSKLGNSVHPRFLEKIEVLLSHSLNPEKIGKVNPS